MNNSIDFAAQTIYQETHKSDVFVEWCIANYLALSFHDSLLYDNPSQVDSDRLAALRLSLEQCASFEEIQSILRGLSEQENFALLLAGLNKNCLSDGWCAILDVFLCL